MKTREWSFQIGVAAADDHGGGKRNPQSALQGSRAWDW